MRWPAEVNVESIVKRYRSAAQDPVASNAELATSNPEPVDPQPEPAAASEPKPEASELLQYIQRVVRTLGELEYMLRMDDYMSVLGLEEPKAFKIDEFQNNVLHKLALLLAHAQQPRHLKALELAWVVADRFRPEFHGKFSSKNKICASLPLQDLGMELALDNTVTDPKKYGNPVSEQLVYYISTERGSARRCVRPDGDAPTKEGKGHPMFQIERNCTGLKSGFEEVCKFLKSNSPSEIFTCTPYLKMLLDIRGMKTNWEHVLALEEEYAEEDGLT